MKRAALFLLALVSAFHAWAQSGQVLVAKYEYQNVGLNEKQTVVLWVSGQESLSKFIAQDTAAEVSESQDGSIRIHMKGNDPLGVQVYKNRAEDTMIFREFISDDGDFVPCVVKDDPLVIEWVLLSEQKMVNGMACLKAKTTIRGRTYTVWYTPDVPVAEGPWKFSGLPGLITEVVSDDKNIFFTLRYVSSIASAPVQPPTDGLSLSFEEFVQHKEQALDDFLRSLQARLPRGAQVSVSTGADYNLETDYSKE